MEHVLRIPQTSNTEFSATLSVGILILLPLLTSIYPFIRYNYVSPSVSIRSVNAGGHSIVSRVLFLFVQYIITFVLIIVSSFHEASPLHAVCRSELYHQGHHSMSVIRRTLFV